MSMEDSSFKGEESGLSADLTWPGVGDRLFLLERASGVSEWEARSPLISSGSIWSPHLLEQRLDAEQAGQEEKDGRRELDGRFTTAELPSFFQTEGPMIDEPLEPEEELKEEQAEEEQVDLSRRGRETISTEDIKSFQARLAAFAEAIRSREGPEGVRESKMTARSAQREEEEEEEEEEGKTKNDRSFTPFSCWGQDKDEKEQFAGHDEEENSGGEERASAGDQDVDYDTDLQEDGAGTAEPARRSEEEGAEEGSRHVRSLSRELRVKLLMRSLITTAQLEDKGVVRGHRIRTQTKEVRLRTTEDRRSEGRSEGATSRASLDARKGGRGGEEKGISCAQRVVWLLLGSGLTSLMALLYLWLFADMISSVRVL